MRFHYKYFSLLAFTFVLGFLPIMLSAQDNLKVSFKSAASSPQNLVVCGNLDTVTVTVSTNGLSSATRQNIQAQLNLFKGVQFVEFLSAGSTAGVVLSNGNASTPVFGLPNLVPNALSSVDIQYVIKVNCNYTDTLTKNDKLVVTDKWDFLYDLGATTGVQESDFSAEYRDALKVPFFTMSVSNDAPSGARVGQCYTRTTVINNSGLDGWVKGFVYTTSQGPGVSISSITINGVTIPYTKNPAFNANGDTLIAIVIPDTVFKYNTKGISGGLADGDNFFEPDETVTILENICIANCNLPRTSTHSMSWGCDSRYCNTISRQDIVQLGQGSTNVSFQSTGTTANIVGGYCTNGSQTVTFTNTGVEVDPGTATMYDLTVGVGLSDSLKANYKGYKITSIKVSGVNIPTVTNIMTDIKDNPLFATDPDGAGGLSDIDGDGFFDDLAVGDKLEVVVQYQVECSASLSDKSDMCTNDFEASFSARLDYTNSCQVRTSSLQPRFFSPVNSSDFVENCIDPDARTDGKVFFIQHKQIRNVFNFERNCNGQEVLQVAIKVPTGVTPVKDSMYMLWFEDTMPLLSYKLSNDTVYMSFDATKAQFINGEYNSRFAFSANCSAIPGSSEFPIETAFYCPPCDCRHVWYCDTLSGPRIHYIETACPPNPAYECADGLKTVDFKVERTTFGYLDDTYTTKLKADEVHTNIALACDSIQMTVSNIVGNTNISDSLGILISYNNIAFNDSNRLKDIFVFDKAKVVITHGGTKYNCTIDKTQMRAVRTDSTKAMYFDLNSCLTSLGIAPLIKGDSVNFIGQFSVNPDGPYKFTFEKIPNFRAYGYYEKNGTLMACDNYGAFFKVGKSQALFSYPSSSNFPVGCNEANLEYKVTMFNNDFAKYFGAEFRQAVGVDSIAFTYDPNLAKAFTTKVEVSIADHPVHGNAFFPLANLDSTGKYSARFDTLVAVPSLNLLTSYAFNFRIKVKPNCATMTGSSAGNNEFYFKPTIYYRDRYYAKEIGDGSCSPYLKDTATASNQKIVYNYPASLEFTPITNPSITTSNDTAEWQVKICNTNDKGGAAHTWLAIEPTLTGKNFKVISVTDITNSSSPVNHTVKLYPTDSSKAFAFLSALAEATPDKTLDDVCNVVKVKALIRECGTTSIKFRTGWLCDLPTSSSWTPASYQCADSTISGQVRTENPFLDANFINQNTASKPGICDTTTLEIVLRNTDIGIAYDVKTSLTIPLQGATLLTDSIFVAYPSGSAYKKVTGAPTYMGISQKGKTYEFANFAFLDSYLNLKGLKGFNASSPNDSNEIKIKFKFTQDCDFKSGSLSYFTFQGKTICGTSSNFEAGESLPIEIQGATLSTPKSYQVSTGATNKLIAGGYTTLEIKFKNLLTTLSDSADEVSVKLPEGVTYKPNSSVAVAPATWAIKEPILTTVGNIQILTWAQPLNMAQNDEATLRFDVNTADSLPCLDTLDMALSTLAIKDLVCASKGTVCKTELITTSNGEHYYTLPLTSSAITASANFTISSNNIQVKVGDTVRIMAMGAQKYRWTDVDSSKILDTDSLLVIVPNRKITNISVASSLTKGCVLPLSLKITMDSITVKDSIAPVITPNTPTLVGKKSGDTLNINSCSNNVYYYLNSVTITDNLDPNPKLTLDSTVATGNCLTDGYITFKTYTWTGTDTSKNSSIYRIFVKIKDTTVPTLAGVPNDTILSLLDTIPAANVTAMDNCTTPTIVSNLVFSRMNGADSLFTRTWTATDICGNVAIDSQIIVRRGAITPSVPERKDTVYIGDTLKYCLSNLGLIGTVNQVANTCPETSNRHVKYVVDGSNCLLMIAQNVGVDTACLTVCTDSNVCTKVKFITQSLVKTVDTIKVVLKVGESDTVCLNKRGLQGTKFTVKNNCPDSSNAAVEYTLDGTCVIIKGMYGGAIKSCWVVCDSTGKCDTTVIVVTVNPTITNRVDTLYKGDSIKYCLSNLSLKGKIKTVTANCQSTSNRFTKLTLDASNCVTILGTSIGIDTACFTVCTDSGVCAVVNFYTQVKLRPLDTVKVTLEKGNKDTVCLTTKRLVGTKFTLTNACPDANNNMVTYQVLNDTCVIITAVRAGTTKGCWALCDTTGKCDTTIINVKVTDSLLVTRRDTIWLTDTLDFCFSQFNFKGKIKTVVNSCPTTSNRNVTYTLKGDSTCLTLKGIKVGIDTACYDVCTDSSECRSINFFTLVRVKPLDTIKVTLEKGNKDTVCLTTRRLVGKKFTLTNVCPDPNNNTVTYQVLNDTCIIITGVRAGTTKGCWALCDTTGKCDTTIINVTVTDSLLVTRRDTIWLTDTLDFCFSQFNFKGKIKTVVNSCPTTSNRNVTYTLKGDSTCLTLKGIKVGIDTACYDVCTDSSECRSINFYTHVLVKPLDTVKVTLEKGSKDTVCLTTKRLVGKKFTLTNVCPDPNNNTVTYQVLNDTCIIITGVRAGTTKGCWALCDTTGKCDTTIINVTVTDSLLVTRRDTIWLTDTLDFCFSQFNFKGKIKTVVNSCPTTSNRNVTYTLKGDSTCLTLKGIKVGIDTACYDVCTDSSECRSINFYTHVLVKPLDTVKVTLEKGSKDTVCLTTKRLVGKKFTLTNVCPDPNNNIVTYQVLNDTCIIITGVRAGTTKGCWALCDTTGKCDTTIINVTVTDSLLVTRRDTITLGDSLSFCFSQFNFKGKIKTVVNSCPTTSNRNATYTLNSDSTCLILRGIKVGIDTACYDVCTDSSECRSINFYTLVRVLPLDTVRVTLEKGEKDTVCISTKRLKGTKFTLTNICADPNERVVNYTTQNDTCVVITAKKAGVSKSCWMICDSTGKCDTTIIFTTVTDSTLVSKIDTVVVGDSLIYCFSDLKFKGKVNKIVNNCASSSNRHAIYTLKSDSSCIVIKGVKLGIDTACFDVCTDSSECKTLEFVTVVIPDNQIINHTVKVGESDTICISMNRPRKLSKPIVNACPDAANTSVEYKVLNDTCVIIKGISIGAKQSCWVICDTADICDTVFINTRVTVDNPYIVRDTIVVGDSVKFCLSRLNLQGQINMVTNNCAASSNIHVKYSKDDGNCIVMKGSKIGVDTACYEVCTDTRECHTVIFYTKVIPNNDTLYVSLKPTEKDTVCISINRPRKGGAITNICPVAVDSIAGYELLGDTCVIVTAKKLGITQSCWVICDTSGVCDTVIMNVLVRNSVLPIAENDSVSTKFNTQIDIPIMDNDTVNGIFKRITLMIEPRYGSATLLQDSVTKKWYVSYIPYQDTCGLRYIDNFVYQLCNESGCDLANIKVKISCANIVVYNAFSPNGDSKNDYFMIEGLENYKNTNVIVYNRWGNKIYESLDYKNDWGGGWTDKKVPDGTYFYQIILETGDIYTGYLQIHH